MKNLEIVVTEDGRIEMTVDGADSFLLETKTGAELEKLRQLLSLAAEFYRANGTCRLTMGEVD